MNAPSIEKQHPYWFYICGFNIGIIAGLFTAGFSRLLGCKWGAVAAIFGIAIYTLLVGASASVLQVAIGIPYFLLATNST